MGLFGRRRRQPDETASLMMEACEPRILYSAELFPVGVVSSETDQLAAGISSLVPGADQIGISSSSQEQTVLRRHELIIVDAATPDREQLVADLLGSLDAEDRDVEVLVLDADSDGIDQITNVLAQYRDLDAVHLISHGSDGEVQLGTGTLNFESLTNKLADIQSWADAFGEDADLLIYGCDLAATQDGLSLATSLARLTGADVAASTDLTGAEALGGDWDLEFNTGEIETAVALSESIQANFQAVLATFTVTNTNDSGADSLRQAIINANANSGADTIDFDIAGSGTQVISLSGSTPQITDAVIIDGTTQTGWVEGSFLPIVIDGNSYSGSGLHFTSTADGSTVRGLVIRDFDDNGIEIEDGADNITIVGNWIGTFNSDGSDAFSSERLDIAGIRSRGDNVTIGGSTDADRNVFSGSSYGVIVRGTSTGTTVAGNYFGTEITGNAIFSGHAFGIAHSYGIYVQDTVTNLVIGGATAAHANVIVDVNNQAIQFSGEGVDGNTIQNNLIGVSADGTTNLGNDGSGIFLTGAGDNNQILDNWITGSEFAGIELDGNATGNVIQGNTIGTDATGTLNWGSGEHGILLENNADNNTIGGTGADQGNVIAFSGQISPQFGAGIWVQDTSTGNAIRGNSIYSNVGIGIDLTAGNVPDGVTGNDAGDTDIGGNNLQNSPVLNAASINDAGLFAYTIDTSSFASGTYEIDFYASTDRDAGLVEGARFLGSGGFVPWGNALFSGFIGGVTLAPGEYVTVIITDGSGNSSEFSNYAVATDSDPEGSAPSDLQAVATTDGGLRLNVDGGNDVVLQADASPFSGQTAVTIEVSFSIDTPATGMTTLLSYATATNQDELYVGIDATGEVFFRTSANGDVGYGSSTTASQLFDGEQHSVAVTWENGGGILLFYVDGEQLGLGRNDYQKTTTIDAGGTTAIGQHQTSPGSAFDVDDTFSGTLHDVRLFSDVRTAEEIASNYRSDLPYDEEGLTANWRFDDLSSDGVITESVTGNNLTVKHTAASGFTTSEASLTFTLSENTLNGTVVGSVSGLDAERDARIAKLLAADPDLQYNAQTDSFYKAILGAVDRNSAYTTATTTLLNGVAGDLPTITSFHENEIVSQLVASTGVSNAWLSGSDAAVADEWRWGDGTQFWQGAANGYSVDGAFENFLAAEPNGGTNTSTVYLSMNTAGQWKDSSAFLINTAAIIEWDADAVLDATDALTYSVTTQTTAGALAIDASTGQITVANGSLLDYETNATHSLTIRITDIASNVYDEVFTVSLSDLAESNNAPTDISSGIELNSDGGNDAYLISNTGLGQSLTSTTVEIQFAAYNTPNETVFLSFNNAAGDEFSLQINDLNGGLELDFGSNAPQYSTTVDYEMLLLDGKLHSLAVSWDSTNGDWAVYVDGEFIDSGTGLNAGVALDTTNGQFVFGQEQDGLDSGYASNQMFSGTLYDIRIWDEVRNATEIGLNYQHKLVVTPTEAAAIGLVANWQMDGFNGSNEVVDIVSGNNLSVGHVSYPATSINSWSNATTGVSVFGSTITFVDDSALDGWNSQINSAAFSTFGFADDYTLSFEAPALAPAGTNGQAYTIGLSTTESNASSADVEYALNFTSGIGDSVRVYLSGSPDSIYSVDYVGGDTFSIHVDGTDLHFQHNGVTFHTESGLTGTEGWYVDTSFNTEPSGDYSDQADYSVSNFRLFDGNIEGNGFTASTPVEDLKVDENASNGTTVGFVVPSDPDVSNDVVSDGLFLEAVIPATFQTYTSPASLGNWQVVQNDVQLLGDSYERTPLGGLSVDLNGSAPAVIEQALVTEAGRQYQVTFALSGEWTGGELVKNIRLSADGQSSEFLIEQPSNWSRVNMLWEHRSFTFVAEDASTTLRISSLDGANIWGPVVGDIQVVEVPHAISTILNNDPTLSYDAASSKFYQTVSTPAIWDTARSDATSAALNGVSGQLVTIRSAYENSLVRAFASNAGADVWLGATDRNAEGEFFWQDGANDDDQLWTGGEGGSATAGSYENFIGTGPDDFGSDQDEVVLLEADGKWDDQGTGTTNAYIIEWDASEVFSSFTFNLIDDASGRFAIDNSTGEVTVANGSLLDYETNTAHSVTVEVTDAAGNTYSEARLIAVVEVKELLVAVNDTFTTRIDAPLIFNPVSNDISDSGDVNAIIEFTQPANGAVINNGGGTLTYTPDPSYIGPDSFEYVAIDSGSGLQHYWRLDGNAVDAIGGADGTLTGTTTVAGEFGNGLSFDETNDYVALPDVAYNSEFTISFEFKLDEINGSLFQYLYSHGDVNSFDSVNVFINEDTHGTDPNVLRTVVRDGNDTLDNSALQVDISNLGLDLVDSQFHTYTLTAGVNGLEVFIDGVLVATDATRGTDGLNPTGNAYLGIRQDLDVARMFGGVLDTIQIFDSVLNSDLVADLAADVNWANVSLTVNPNIAPTLDWLDGDYVEVVNDGVAVVFDTAIPVEIVDIDGDANFNGGSVQVAGTSFEAVDQLGIETTGAIAFSAGYTNGSAVTVSGTSIGSLSLVTHDGLTLTLNANASNTLVESFISSLTFESTSVVFGSRAIDVEFTDGSGTVGGGADSVIASLTVNLASNDNGSVTAVEDTVFVYSASDFDFSGVVGTSLRDITVTNLPVAGLLRLNGSLITVGQSISKAEIDAGQLTFEAGQDSNGTAYASFDFYVNSGRQSVTILTGKPSQYTLNSLELTKTDDILMNESNFGASGTYPTDLQFGSTSTSIDAAYLTGGEILFGGYVSDSSLDAGELTAIDNWVSGGGVLVSTNDSALYDPIAEHFGLVIGGTASSTWHIADSGTSIINGAFGSVGNVGDSFQAAGSIAYFDSASLSVGDLVIATDSVSGEPTIVLRENGDGWILFTGDEGIFRTGMTGSGSIVTPNDILTANLFGWAVNAVPETYLKMDIDVSAVNDVPFIDLDANNSSASGVGFAATWTEGSGPVAIADTDATLIDVDSTNLASLTVTLTNQLDGGAEVLTADTTGTAIVASYDADTGVLSLSGIDSVANYQTVLRALTYNNTFSNPNETTRSITFVASDGIASSALATTSLSIVSITEPGVTVIATTSTGIGEQVTVNQLQATADATYFRQGVAMDAQGNSVVVWASSDLTADGSLTAVMARRFDVLGNPVGDEFRVNATATDKQEYASVAMDDAGNFVVVWTSSNQDGSGEGVYAQRYNAVGVAQGVEFRVNATFLGNQSFADIDMDADGDFVVVWQGQGVGDNSGVFGQRYDAGGVAQGGEFRANETIVNTQSLASVALDVDGNFVIAWTSRDQDGDGRGVYMRRYGSTGIALEGERLVTTITTGDQWISNVSMNASGQFGIAWRDDGQVEGLFLQLYNADGTVNGGEIAIPSSNSGGTNYPQVAMDYAGNVVVVWEDFVDSDDYAIVARQFDASGTPLGAQFVVNTHEQWYQQYPSLAITPDGQFTVVFTDYDRYGDGKETVEMRRFGATTTEAGGVANVTVVLDTQPSDDVTIDLSMPDGTEGSLSTTQLTFTSGDWSVAQTVTVTGVNDVLADGNVTHLLVTANAVSLDTDYNGLAVADVRVTNLDDEPNLDLDSDDSVGAGLDYATTWTEAGGGVAVVDADASLIDPDSAILTSLVVTITNQLDGTAEVLAADTTGTSITASYASATGILTLSGADSVANYETVLGTITYDNSSDTPDVTARSVSFVASDGSNTSPVATTVVSIAPTDDPVNVNTTGNTVTFSEAAGATVSLFSAGIDTIESTDTISQVALSLANVEIGDTLVFGPIQVDLNTNGATGPDGNGFTYTVSSAGASPVVTIAHAGADDATVNTMLNSLVFNNTINEAPSNTARTVTLTSITDSGSGSTAGGTAATVNVVATNDVPVNTVPGTQTLVEETVTAINGISIADVDDQGANLTTRLEVSAGVLNVTLSGSATISAGTNGSADLTILGSETDINATLAGLTYTGNTDVNGTGADTLTVTTDDQGNTGSGGAQQDVDTAQINITAVNDAPANTVPGPQTIAEETTTAISGISIADVDAGASNLTTRLQVSSGVLNVTLSGSATISASTNGTADLTVLGTMTDINAALASLAYTGNADVIGVAADTLTITTNDLGNTGSGGALQDGDTVQIDLTAVNDAPVNSVPGTQTIAEETVTAIGGISIADVDDLGNNLSTRLQVSNGILNVTLSGAATISAGADGSADLTILGSESDLNNTLASLTYTGNISVTGIAADTLSITTNDLGNSGSGGAQQDVDTVQIDLSAVNDAPVVTAPGSLSSATEQVGLVIHGAGFGVSDVDEAGGGATAVLNVGEGALSIVVGDSGIAVDSGNATGTVTISGSIGQINNLLTGAGTGTIAYLNNSNTPSASTVITVTVNDQGNTGADPGLSGDATSEAGNNSQTINLTALNDAPVNTVPGTQTIAEETSTNISGISIADVDDLGANLTSRLQVTAGTLSLSLAGSATISAGTNGSGDLTILGSEIDINATLVSLTYTGNTDVNGVAADTLTVTTNDQGNTGSGGAQQDIDTVQIDITAVNDAPINTVPGTQTIAEETGTVINGISIADVDDLGANLTTQLQVTAGVLNVTLSGSATISAGSNSSADLTILGSETDINATLAMLTYTGNNDVNGVAADTLTVTTDDGGNTGSGGAQQDVDTVQLNIIAVNDVPVNTVPGTQTIAEETSTAISGISIADVDDLGANLTTRLQVTAGVLNVTLSGTATVFAGSNGSTDLTILGPEADINATLASLSYTGNTDVNGVAADTLTVTTNDQGNTGSGGAQQDVDTVQIDITAVNDIPVVSVNPVNLAFTEQTPLGIDINASITDVDSATLASATIRISANYEVGDDQLQFTDQNGITGSYNNGTGLLSLTGGSSVANYQTALRSIVFDNQSDDPLWATRTIEWIVNDGANDSVAVARDIDVNPVNDAPVNTVSGTQAVAEETATTITGISIVDADDQGANLTTRLQVTAGVLNVTLSGAASISVGANGSADLTILGSKADINLTLASLTYTGNTDVNGVAADTLTVTTDDGGNTGSGGVQQDVDTVQIDITAVNDAPVLSVDPVNLSFTEQSPVGIDIGTSITDVDSATLSSATIRISANYEMGVDQLQFTDQNGISGAYNNGTGVLTLTGVSSVANYQNALRSIVFDNQSDDPSGTVRTVEWVVNDGTNDSVAVPRDIDVTVVNDAPVNIMPGTQTVAEETATAISGMSIADADDQSANLTTRLQVSNGALNVTLSGSVSISAGSNATGDLTILGTEADINATLASLMYTGDADVNGIAADTLTVTTNDGGNTGSGGAEQGVDTMQIDIAAVNDAPINTVPGTQTIAEETSASISGISIADVDDLGANLSTQLQVTAGTLSVSLSGSATISAGTNGSGDLTILGSEADINATLAGLTFTGNTDVNGIAADTLTVTTDDQSNTGSGGAQQDVDTVQINITAMNDAPINTVPGTQTIVEETSTAIAAISIADVDDFGANLITRLQVTAGVLNVTLSGSASISAGVDGSDDLTILGSEADINATLASLTYTSNTDVTGTAADTLTVTTDDQGNTGSGGAQQDVDTVQIDITAVNDAPINTIPGTQTVAEETSTAITGISIADVDDLGANLTTQLQVTAGTLSVTLSGSATISAGTNASGDLTILGSETDIDATLASLTYIGNTDVNGVAADTLTVTTNDQGNTGSGGAQQDVDTVQIDITAVNDAPVNTVPGTQTVAEETSTAITGISIADVDDLGASLATRLQVTAGVLNLTLSGSATISAGFIGSNDLTVLGSETDINATLGSLTYTGPDELSGVAADTLMVTTNDQGNTGAGGALQAQDNVAIDIAAVNDNSPVINTDGGGNNASLSVAENTAAITTVGATDADLPAQTLLYSIIGGVDAALFAIDGTSGDLVFTAEQDYELPGDADADRVYQILVQASDGAGLADTQAIAVTVTPVNDNDPVITSNGGGGTALIGNAENTTVVTTIVASDADSPTQALIFSIIGGADAALFSVDSNNGALSLNAGLDFEAPIDADGDNLYEIQVGVDDGAGRFDAQAISVQVLPSNDFAPLITSNGGGALAALTLIENVTAVTTVTATDADLPAQSLSYAIGGGADAIRFVVDSVSGALTFAQSPNYESPQDANADGVYEVLLSASDGSLVSTQVLRITVANINEAPSAIEPAQVSVSETLAAGARVADLSARDPDTGETVNFSLVSDPNGLFRLDAVSGQLALRGPARLDFETSERHELLVRVTDSGGLSYEQLVVVTVTDAREATPTLEPPPISQLPMGPPIERPSKVPSPSTASPEAPLESLVDEYVPILRSDEPLGRSNSDLVIVKRATPDIISIILSTTRQPVEAELLELTLSFDWTAPLATPEIGLFDFQPLATRTVSVSFGDATGLPLEDRPSESLLDLALDPVRVASSVLSVGAVWWLTRSGGLIATMLMGIPTWRHLDLLPIVSNPFDEEKDNDETDSPDNPFSDSKIDALFDAGQ